MNKDKLEIEFLSYEVLLPITVPYTKDPLQNIFSKNSRELVVGEVAIMIDNFLYVKTDTHKYHKTTVTKSFVDINKKIFKKLK